MDLTINLIACLYKSLQNVLIGNQRKKSHNYMVGKDNSKIARIDNILQRIIIDMIDVADKSGNVER